MFFLDADNLQQSGIAHGFFGRRGGVSTGIYESLNCGPGSGDDLATELHRRTGGHPFFVSEMAIAPWRAGRPIDLTEVPDGIRDWIGHRADALPKPVRARLDLAAVVGDTCRVATIARCAHVPQDQVLDELDVLVDEGFMVETGRVDEFTFAHLITRDAIYEQVFTRCWNPERKAFTQHPGTDVVDAITLLMPLVGMISPDDPMWLSTLDAIGEELVSDSLVYRYNPSASPDGLAGSEGTFSLCSFFYVCALTDAGRLDEAQYAFEKMLTYGNHLGLYAEEIDQSGLQLGNFPQAFTHLALIRAAIALDAALTSRGAR